MKTILLTTAALILLSSSADSFTVRSSQKGIYEINRDRCVAKAGIDVAMIDDIDSGKNFATFDDLNCFTECLYDSYGFFDKDGNFLDDVIYGFLAIEFTGHEDQLAQKCYGLKGSTKCETSYKIHKCIMHYINHVAEL